MSSIIVLALIVLAAAAGLVIIYFLWKTQHAHTAHYIEGLRNENDGRYELALHNYEDALNEIRKLRMSKKFGTKIVQRIKILRTTINYERAFQSGTGI